MIKFHDILMMKQGMANYNGMDIPLGQVIANPYLKAFSSVQEQESTAVNDEDDTIEEYCPLCLAEVLSGKHPEQLGEAEYRGRKIKLGKIMRGDVKKFKVFVKDPKTGNIKKVNFGDPNMKIKKYIPARRKSFRARHNCDNPGPRTKARYWACRTW
jgi:hypothetical protein